MRDKLYGMSTEVIKEVMKRGWIPVVKIEESLHRGIRDELRKIALKSYTANQEIYKKCCLIESFFGTTKGMFGSYLEERTEKMAFHVVFAQIALWNIENILFIFFITLRYRKNFQTASRLLDNMNNYVILKKKARRKGEKASKVEFVALEAFLFRQKKVGGEIRICDSVHI